MPERHTDGSRGLRAFIEKHGLTQLAAASALGVTAPCMHDWVTGAKRPRLPHRKSIEIWTRGEVPTSAWEYAEEQSLSAAVVPFDPSPDDSGAHVAIDADTSTAKSA